ncbi:choice-of-anchor L domain-containing protein [Paraliomyxa miuraensis]|uniref:choice-of-anchor L domain-containing protein n=1 Tax=Paraliomyxa miuraensis TaxID=376150 RepID=UPI00225317E2|nr:choice-of-anchor L domain-containing protein [Paraliomyxa miuraensis]MCX4247214.1 choice-of-anchor L domain-containing protein [Paraliomyxa miuraensis]
MRELALACSSLLTLGVLASGCTDDSSSDEATTVPFTTGITTLPLTSTGSEDDPGDDTLGKLDVVMGTGDTMPCAEGGDCGECVPSTHTPCDQGANSMISALGLNCPGDAQVEVTTFGSPAAMAVRTGFGATGEWDPREGSAFAVLGSGFVTDLDLPTPPGDLDIDPTHCNDDLGLEYDMGTTLPAPIQVYDVSGDCATNPALLGTGDCSNTIEGQFNQGGSANDYTEIRIVADVPVTNNSINYDFAFFSTEYPWYYNSAFNDMYIGWLESESWTGNISFDNMGNPISLNAGFLDFRDDGGGLAEFQGTCMARHAGTKWLQSVAPVTPGETITLVLAVFDLSDSILDSYVFLDNFGWGCEGDSTPMTNPIG